MSNSIIEPNQTEKELPKIAKFHSFADKMQESQTLEMAQMWDRFYRRSRAIAREMNGVPLVGYKRCGDAYNQKRGVDLVLTFSDKDGQRTERRVEEKSHLRSGPFLEDIILEIESIGDNGSRSPGLWEKSIEDPDSVGTDWFVYCFVKATELRRVDEYPGDERLHRVVVGPRFYIFDFHRLREWYREYKMALIFRGLDRWTSSENWSTRFLTVPQDLLLENTPIGQGFRKCLL